MNSKPLVVIPARYASSRFPGKPLVELCGVSLIQRVWALASSVERVRVVVATDDERIFKHVEDFGGEAVMTDDSCRTGTDRVRQAVELLDSNAQHVFSFQGDAVLTPPWVLEEVLVSLEEDASLEISTPAILLDAKSRDAFIEAKRQGSSSGTSVVFDAKGDALYFSKAALPFVRNVNENNVVMHRHIGLYGYRRDALFAFSKLPEGTLERIEKLEQLRALEAGMRIKVVVCDLKNRTLLSVDNPEDVQMVEDVIRSEGELVV